MRHWLILMVIAFTLALMALTAAQTKATTNTKGKTPAITCPVSGETIENPSKALRYTYKGKTYYFCCKDCLSKFKASPATYRNRKPARANAQTQATSKSCCSGEKGEQTAGKSCCGDKKGVAENAQSGEKADKNNKGQANSPQSAKLFCPVSEEEITPDEAIAFEYNGKRYYVCCSNCRRKFLADPETYAKKAEQLSPLQGKPIEKESR